jgi:hypothetical protein
MTETSFLFLAVFLIRATRRPDQKNGKKKTKGGILSPTWSAVVG